MEGWTKVIIQLFLPPRFLKLLLGLPFWKSGASYFFSFLKMLLIYLVAWGLGCGIWDLCTGSFVVVYGLSSCVAQVLNVGSVVAVCRLTCSTACGILVNQPGIKPMSPAL